MSSRAIRGPCGRGNNGWRGGSVACNRASFSRKVSPAAPGGFCGAAAKTAGAVAIAGSHGCGNSTTGTDPIGCLGTSDTPAAGCGGWPCLVFEPRAFGLNHRRNASSDSSIPNPRNPALIAEIDAPERRSFNSSLRWGSSWSVLGFFGQRARVTNSVRVGFTTGVIPEWSGGGVGVMWERYSERCGGATGAALAASRPAGLDVGVFPHYFAYILVILLSSFWDLLSRWFIRLVDLRVFGFGSSIVCWYVASFVKSLDSIICWLNSLWIGSGSHSLVRSLVVGGSEC